MADRPLVDKTAERLMAFILDNGYEVGQKLPNEYDLSEALGAGRSTVREAVRSLVARNILEVRQGSGTYISSKRGVVEDPFGFAIIILTRVTGRFSGSKSLYNLTKGSKYSCAPSS